MWEAFYRELVTKGGYQTVLNGLLVTVEVSVFGLLIGIVIGTLIAVVKVIPKKNKALKVVNAICVGYVELFRGTPMAVQLLIGYWVLLPLLGVSIDGVVVAIVVFGLNSGAYVSEIMRAGIESVDGGQLEAGRALGLSFGKAMLKIVIPQSIKNILPTLGNEFITLIKETSVLSFIAVIDLYRAFQKIGESNMSFIIPYLMLALVYLVLVLIIAFFVRLIEKKLKKGDKSWIQN